MVSPSVGSEYHDVSRGFRVYNCKTFFRLNLYGRCTYTQKAFKNLAENSHIRITDIPIEIDGEENSKRAEWYLIF